MTIVLIEPVMKLRKANYTEEEEHNKDDGRGN